MRWTTTWVGSVIAAWAAMTPGGGAGEAVEAVRIAVVTGFEVPESARYDPDLDRYYVSNVTGAPAVEDDTGFISLMDPDGRVANLRWIDGRSASVTLHAPKGLAIVGDELWAADITVVRRFDRLTGSPVGVIDLGPLGARFLNDLANGPDGTVFVSDTGFTFEGGRMALGEAQRVYQIDRAGRVTVVVEGTELHAPNGLFYDEPHARLLIAPLNSRYLLAWTPAEGLVVAATGPGSYDGIERMADGRLLVSSQEGRSILTLEGRVMVPLITGVSDVGDLGVDLKRHRVAIPRLDTNVLELWQVR